MEKYKNIFIIGSPRCGKTTLARWLVKKKGYSMLSVDDLVTALDRLEGIKMYEKGNAIKTAKNIEPFLECLLTELSEGPNFYNGVKYVIEGTYFDFEKLYPFIKNKLEEKYYLIGLTQNDVDEFIMYDNIKKYDTEDDWTYYLTDDDLKKNVKYFIDRNKYFVDEFKKYNIDTYDTSHNRDKVIEDIINKIDDKLI